MLKILTMDTNRKINLHQAAFVLFFLVFTTLENGVLGQCLKNPVNKVAKEGEKDILINCAPNPDQVEWRCHSASDELDNALINNNESVVASDARNAFALDPNGLRIFEATIYGGKYELATAAIYVAEDGKQTRVAGAKLVVIRDGPVCKLSESSPSNGDPVVINCSTTYADHSIHPIRPFMTVTLGDVVIAAQTLTTSRISPYYFFAWLSVAFAYNACVPITVVQTFNRPTDLQYKFIAQNAPAFSNSVTFPATSEDCLQYPRNIAVREGAKDTMVYSTHNPMTVKRTVAPTSDQVNFYTITDFGKDVTSSLAQLYAVSKAGLLIHIATAEAGQYLISTGGIYKEEYRNKVIRGFKVVIVRSGPTCSSKPGNSDSVELTCTFEYADHTVHEISPVIVFKRNGVVKATSTPPRSRKNEHTIIATASTVFSSDSSAVDECLVTFNPPPSNDDLAYMASNAPDYSESCNY